MYCVLFILSCIVCFTFFILPVFLFDMYFFLFSAFFFYHVLFILHFIHVLFIFHVLIILFISGNSVDDRDCTFVFPSAGIGVVQELDIMDDTSTSTQSFLGNTTPNTPHPQFAHR